MSDTEALAAATLVNAMVRADAHDGKHTGDVAYIEECYRAALSIVRAEGKPRQASQPGRMYMDD